MGGGTSTTSGVVSISEFNHSPHRIAISQVTRTPAERWSSANCGERCVSGLAPPAGGTRAPTYSLGQHEPAGGLHGHLVRRRALVRIT